MQNKITRRSFNRQAGLIALSSIAAKFIPLNAFGQNHNAIRFKVRPSGSGWPNASEWRAFEQKLEGSLIRIDPPLVACKNDIDSDACKEIIGGLKNPFYISDSPAFTQTSGWYKAWNSQPSQYVVEANNAQDIAAAVKFAGRHNLRLVVKGGGHSYQGNSNAPDSLMIWTRKLRTVEMANQFIPAGAGAKVVAEKAVIIGAGARWMEAYREVSVKNGMYVQGGGCTTVGVAGFIQGGGFGSFSKHYGLGAAGLLEAEVVTATGEILTVNRFQHSDLFWALKGGGGGNFAIISKLVLRARELPPTFGAVFAEIKAANDEAYRQLIKSFLVFYKTSLFNYHWGEQATFTADNKLKISMLFCGQAKEEANNTWDEFKKQVAKNESFSITSFTIIELPAQSFWDESFLTQHASSVIAKDERKEAAPGNYYWRQNGEEAGQYLWGYKSTWVSQKHLGNAGIDILSQAIFEASRYWSATLHFNKGLAGARIEDIEAAKNTAINPSVLDAFALLIIAGQDKPSFEGIKGLEPDVKTAEWGAKQISLAMDSFIARAGHGGSYVAESDYFEKDWQQSFWGDNYKKLQSIKHKWDPKELFYMYHGVGSEGWSNDGFEKTSV